MKRKSTGREYKNKNVRRRLFDKPTRAIAKVPRPISGFPLSQTVKLRYVAGLLMNPAQGLSEVWVIRANSLYDPDLTFVGHQPYGHDQWKDIYNHYSVQSAKCTATFMSSSSTPANACASCSITLKDDFTADIAPAKTSEESGRAAYKCISSSSGSGAMATISKSFNAKRFLASFNRNSNFNRAAFGSNPTEGAFFHIKISPIIPTQTSIGTYVQVTVDYTALLSEPMDFLES